MGQVDHRPCYRCLRRVLRGTFLHLRSPCMRRVCQVESWVWDCILCVRSCPVRQQLKLSAFRLSLTLASAPSVRLSLTCGQRFWCWKNWGEAAAPWVPVLCLSGFVDKPFPRQKARTYWPGFAWSLSDGMSLEQGGHGVGDADADDYPIPLPTHPHPTTLNQKRREI